MPSSHRIKATPQLGQREHVEDIRKIAVNSQVSLAEGMYKHSADNELTQRKQHLSAKAGHNIQYGITCSA